MPLDKIVAGMLKQMADIGGPSLMELGPLAAREMYLMMQSTVPAPDVASVQDSSAGDVPIRVYKYSNNQNQPAVVFYHGGGWVIGDLETHDGICRQLAIAAECTVIAVDYRLAPEHPYPAAIDDSFAATKWIAKHAASLGINQQKIAVAGDSAGGNLAACVCLKAKAEGGPELCHQLLIYPVTDAKMDTDSYEKNKEGFSLTKATMQWFWDCYADGEDALTPYASPLTASNLEGLPPACVITAEYDPLCDEGEAYAHALSAANVPTNQVRFDGMIHGFFGNTHLLEGSKQAMDLAAEQLKLAFSE